MIIQLLFNTFSFQRELYKCPYILYITNEGNEAYIDLETHTILWNCPRNIEETYHITIEDIKVHNFLNRR